VELLGEFLDRRCNGGGGGEGDRSRDRSGRRTGSDLWRGRLGKGLLVEPCSMALLMAVEEISADEAFSASLVDSADELECALVIELVTGEMLCTSVGLVTALDVAGEALVLVPAATDLAGADAGGRSAGAALEQAVCVCMVVWPEGTRRGSPGRDGDCRRAVHGSRVVEGGHPK
jgi:hypothetical protein